MNKKAKRRLVVVGGIVVIAMLVIVAIAGSGGSASSLSIGDVLGGGYEGKKVQVSGSVVADSLTSEGSRAIFEIAPEDGDAAQELTVSYDGALPATFGTGVVAICTGTVTDGMLNATEMVTKCPSKYESAEGSLTVKGLLDQGEAMVGKDTKVCGYVRGDIQAVDADYRFEIESQGATLKVRYDGGLDENIVDGCAVVITGSLGEDGTFTAAEQPAIDEAVSE
ncbi:cytochrome c maturation protein CcmE [Collinsella tanakaei]|uniref:cytochrome c maturation protein CcmE domain-containing protein n=1 Tax=Collinsella tanakaei TaxID=626935 RepID=UPI00195DAC29|nr:cytochrome c maturation protein CcmE [Collinsella tanakaei]MBM6868849.1 cytochrome c maturation protein CcmE [Collinsella tanakaei]